MKNAARSFLLGALTLGASTLAHAQTSAKTGLATLPTPTGALLRWSLPGGTLPGAYRLIREGGGQRVSRDLPGIVDRATAIKNNWLSAEDYDALKELLSTPQTDARQKLSLQLQILANPNWARTLNLLTEDSGLKAGVTYSYRVLAVRGSTATEFAHGSVTPGPTPPVPTPSALKATPGVGRATLTWLPAGGLTMAYRVYRGQGTAALQLLLPSPYFPTTDAAKPSAAVSFQDPELQRKATYRYQVSALDLFGREGAKTEVLSVDLRYGEPLPQPLIREAVSLEGGKGIRLSWDAADDPRVNGYVLLRGDTPNDLKPLKELTATTYTDSGVTPAQKYFYALALRLTSGSGQGSVSGAGPVTQGRAINKTPPPAPTGLKAIRSEDGTVALSWNASPAPDLLGYLVVQSGTPDAALSDSAMLTGQPISGTRMNIALDGVAGGKFSYRVLAVNTTGVNSLPSVPATVTVPGAPVWAATLNRATGRDSAIELKWSYPQDDAGRVQPPAQVEVFRQNPNGELTLIARLPGTTTTYADTHVVPLLPYAYTVAMLSAAGKRSDASNVLAASALYQPNVGAVEGFKAQLNGGTATLSWKPVPDATSYQVFRIRNGTPLLLGTVTALNFTDSGASAGVTYRVVPRAVDGSTGQAAEVVLR
ncbi:hypothetical protein MF271_17460 (plasmid) [Deinococcus sp. KNUC1210]|uniref:fibronectin type III domain-containing protein n=1 Tax=Deinococcus sp. KNUC1210 TaxID=2917691 RepID=UPI001EF0C47E|nr:hypothetical protein [Deinococcus sp. KNUC1210]ULH16969.1 hypothetical protein MF271_17460 [Deinococcus sp. KNUC1210]